MNKSNHRNRKRNNKNISQCIGTNINWSKAKVKWIFVCPVFLMTVMKTYSLPELNNFYYYVLLLIWCSFVTINFLLENAFIIAQIISWTPRAKRFWGVWIGWHDESFPNGYEFTCSSNHMNAFCKSNYCVFYLLALWNSKPNDEFRMES